MKKLFLIIAISMMFACAPKIITQAKYLQSEPVPPAFLESPAPCPCKVKTFADLVEYAKCIQGRNDTYQLLIDAIINWQKSIKPVE
jgi:hypothetical protein